MDLKDLVTYFCCFHLGIYLFITTYSSGADAFWIANLNISFWIGNQTVWEIEERGVFAKASPLKKVTGVLVPPEGLHQNACSSVTTFTKPVHTDSWIALIMRGQCSFMQKISVAAEKGAVGVIIYNYPGTGNSVFPMFNLGVENIVAVMIGNLKGLDLLLLIQNGIQVMVTIDVGKHYYPWLTHYMGTIFVFASVAVAYFTFYCVRRLRTGRDLTQRCRQLLAIKKAMNHLELRTLKEDDKEVGSAGENCAVCLEMYKPKDVARVLDCRHLFHKTCVDPWLLKHQTCPVCKWDMLGTVESVTTETEPLVGNQISNEASSIISTPNVEAYEAHAHAGMQKAPKAQSVGE
ncbi:RING finger protein 148 [Anolis sagrei]|uniref:RING finger protein 148 n=1 Tax=Anolis sagrei TaxID=38937 RepID=UPI00295BD39F|nr:RING finger protein 148 [Anolis sagrei ordinatus]